MNRKLLLGIIISLVILIVIVVVILILGPSDKAIDTTTSTDSSNLTSDLESLSSGDEVIDQNMNSEIVDLGK
jgi:uncharacterized protein YpmS